MNFQNVWYMQFQYQVNFSYMTSLVSPLRRLSYRYKNINHCKNVLRCHFGLAKHFRTRFLSNRTEINLNKTWVRPVLTYGPEAWGFKKQDENRLLIFERSIWGRIFSSVGEGGSWRRRKNAELASHYKDYGLGGDRTTSIGNQFSLPVSFFYFYQNVNQPWNNDI